MFLLLLFLHSTTSVSKIVYFHFHCWHVVASFLGLRPGRSWLLGKWWPWCAEKTSALFELHFEFSSSYVSLFSFYTHIWADWNLLFELQLRFSSLYMPVFTVWIAVFFYAYLGRMEIFDLGPKCCRPSYVSVCSGLHWLVLHSEIFELHLEFSSSFSFLSTVSECIFFKLH